MITVIIKATDKNNLRDLIRSLIGNAASRENYRIYVGGEEAERDGAWLDVMSEFKDSADMFLMTEDKHPNISDARLLWMLSDDVFVLGRQWDKGLLFYADKYPDAILALLPSGYKAYGTKSEEEIAVVAERNPVVSSKWAQLVGVENVEMICRSLFMKHGIDRRVDIRRLNLMQRGAFTSQPLHDSIEVEKKAQVIADYINGFTPSSS